MNTSKHDKHIFDPFIKYLGKQFFVVSFALSMLLFGVVISVVNSNWAWFSRFGSLITIAGLLAMSSPIFIKGVYLSSSSAFSLPNEDEDDKAVFTSKEDREIGDTVFLGIVITIVGTFIWGFGDLLGMIFIIPKMDSAC